MGREIEFLKNRFVPLNETCSADERVFDDTVICGNIAVLYARVDGIDYPVCHAHLVLLCKEKWPVNQKSISNLQTFSGQNRISKSGG